MDTPDDLAVSLEAIQLDDRASVSAAVTTLNDLPNDVWGIILKPFSKVGPWGNGQGGLSHLRLVNRRVMHAVENWATHLSFDDLYGTWSLPTDSLQRCKSIQHITVGSTNLPTLDGAPSTLKTLHVVGMSYRLLYLLEGGPVASLSPLSICLDLQVIQLNDATAIHDLSPLATCTKIKSLTLHDSQITNISAVASMPLLENLALPKESYQKNRYFDDLSPLLKLENIKRLNFLNNDLTKDLSPLDELKRKFPRIEIQLKVK